jgi:peptide/nickel transport system substrate-binding protein
MSVGFAVGVGTDELFKQDLDRRAFLRRSLFMAAGLGFMGSPAFLAACSSSSHPSSSTPGPAPSTGGGPTKPVDTLHIPFLADMQVPDPDIFYEGEGLQVTLSVYEGLLQYAPVPPNTPITYQPAAKRIAPLLAQSWEVSTDGLTYTFHLRPGVKFHDGTPADAESWRKGLVRRAGVNQGPAYMVAPIASTAAPDPVTLVIVLKNPVDPFLDYLACPWSPKAVSPTAIAAHATGGDLAQKWMTTNDAGTGPYRITEFVPSDHYTLEAFPDHWGPPPEVKKVVIPIIPDVQTQQLKFKTGELDMITKGLPIQDVQSFEKDPKFRVRVFPIASVTALYMNPTKGRMFSDQNLRQAVRSAINRKALVNPVYKDTATIATQFYPSGCFPDGAAPDTPVYDPSQLTKLVKGLSSKKVDLAYGLQGGATNRLLAELVATELQATGLNVTVRGIPTSQEFALYNTPDGQRPDMLLDVWGGDAMHVDTDVRIFLRTGAAPLNWFNYGLSEADASMDAGAAATSQDEVIKQFAATANAYIKAGFMLSIANNDDVFVSRSGITNFVHDPQAAQTVRLAELKRG